MFIFNDLSLVNSLWLGNLFSFCIIFKYVVGTNCVRFIIICLANVENDLGLIMSEFRK